MKNRISLFMPKKLLLQQSFPIRLTSFSVFYDNGGQLVTIKQEVYNEFTKLYYKHIKRTNISRF